MSINLSYHDIVNGPVQPDPLRPALARYAIGVKLFRAHLCAMAGMSGRVTLTFDDGGAGAYVHAAEELELAGWKGTFLITTDWIHRPGFMSAGQLRELRSRGHTIGSHTCSHPARMAGLPWDHLLTQWRNSRALLSDLLGEDITIGSVPNGYYSRRVAEAASVSGIKVLYTSEPTRNHWRIDACLVLGRYSIIHNTTPAQVRRLAAHHPLACFSQSAAWQVKKLGKSLLGTAYPAVRAILPGVTPAAR